LLNSTLEWISRNDQLEDLNEALVKSNEALKAENAQLQDEQSALRDQVEDLGAQVDFLSDLIDNHAELNDQLNASTTELEFQIDRLEAANAEYAKLNQELRRQVTLLEGENANLKEQNEIFQGLNQNLTATAQDLDDQVDELSEQVDALNTQNAILEGTVEEIKNQTERLEEQNNELNATVISLETEVDRLENATAEYQDLNEGLETIASFLNDTAGDLGETYQQLTDFLAEQIDAYRSVAIETLHNTYIQRVAQWDCAYRDHFGDDDFAYDEDLEIPSNRFGEVMIYINDRVLKDLCLSVNDFDHYLEKNFDPPSLTSNHIVAGINSYTLLARNYYFPDVGEEGGLTVEDWSKAGFSCDKLPSDKRFLLR